MIKITTINEWRKHVQSLKKLNESFNEYGVHNGYLALTNFWDKVCKPSQIASIPETMLSGSDQKEEILDYLHSLEMFRYENIGENVPKWNPDLRDGKHTTENYIMYDEKTNSYYFVDTQGYDYPRYMTKLIDFTPSTEQSDSSMQLIPNNESKEIDSDDNKVAKEWNKLSKEERKKEYGQEGVEIDYEKDYENQTQSAKNKLNLDIKKKETNPITPEANENKEIDRFLGCTVTLKSDPSKKGTIMSNDQEGVGINWLDGTNGYEHLSKLDVEHNETKVAINEANIKLSSSKKKHAEDFKEYTPEEHSAAAKKLDKMAEEASKNDNPDKATEYNDNSIWHKD